jgi:hypothetical protein
MFKVYAKKNIGLEEYIFWDIMPCTMLKSTDVSEEYIASIFRVEE